MSQSHKYLRLSMIWDNEVFVCVKLILGKYAACALGLSASVEQVYKTCSALNNIGSGPHGDLPGKTRVRYLWVNELTSSHTYAPTDVVLKTLYSHTYVHTYTKTHSPVHKMLRYGQLLTPQKWTTTAQVSASSVGGWKTTSGIVGQPSSLAR